MNREVDAATAEKMHAIFLEIIIAPSFTPEAFEILSAKKNLRLLTVPFTTTVPQKLEVTSVLGGVVVQERDLYTDAETNFEVGVKGTTNS